MLIAWKEQRCPVEPPVMMDHSHVRPQDTRNVAHATKGLTFYILFYCNKIPFKGCVWLMVSILDGTGSERDSM